MIYIHLIRRTYVLPTHKRNHTYLINSHYSKCILKKYSRLYHFSQRRHLQACKTFFWVIFLVSSPPSTIILGFPLFLFIYNEYLFATGLPLQYAKLLFFKWVLYWCVLVLVNRLSFQCYLYHYHLVLPRL